MLMKLHFECRGRRFESDRIERCVAQSGRARMFHLTLSPFQARSECRKDYINLSEKQKRIFSKLVASISNLGIWISDLSIENELV